MIQRKHLTNDQALQKIRHYCAYQERCHAEVKEKLYAYGIRRKDAEVIICSLIEENFLNEERYTKSFARGKFRMNQWGKQKIKYQLKQKNVSTYCIEKAMSEIDEKIYREVLQKLARAKWDTLNEKNIFVKKRKILNYLVQKGFESEFVHQAISNLSSTSKT